MVSFGTKSFRTAEMAAPERNPQTIQPGAWTDVARKLGMEISIVDQFIFR
jgi:hypothetical protein